MSDRRSQLVAGASLGDLTQEEMSEMAALGVRQGEVEAMELAAAAVVLAQAKSDAPMPPALYARLTAGLPAPQAKVIRPKRDVWRAAGWLAAAACLAFAITAMVRPWKRGAPTASESRAALLSAPDAMVLAWTASSDPAGSGAKGDVVWSNAEQRGFMRFSGLSQNDPAATEYQLWIFDADRDEKFPVDGGVFDVSKGGEVIVPIRAKLHVDKPTLFAVTIERPGGVVVSKRERIVVTAKAGG